MMLDNLTYRKAVTSDLPYLTWLRQQTMAEHLVTAGIQTDEQTSLERILYQFESAKIIVLDGKPIGLMKVVEADGKIEIIQIQIEPQHQRKGYGAALIQQIISEAEPTKTTVFLSVLKKNWAQNLYQRMGMKIVGEDESSYLMELKF